MCAPCMRGGITFKIFSVYLCHTLICICHHLPHLWTVLLLISLGKKNKNCCVCKCELLDSYTEFCKMSPYTNVVKAPNCRFFFCSPALSFPFIEYIYYVPKPFVDLQRLSCFLLHCETECLELCILPGKKKKEEKTVINK